VAVPMTWKWPTSSRVRSPRKTDAGAQSFQIESFGALTSWWSMIFSEDRSPLFRIML
jgi:hypothetical protein